MDASTHKAQVGHRLRMAIEAVGKKPAEIARDFGITQSKLGNWLRGSNYPDVWFLCQFCNRYNITTDWIYLERVSAMSGPVADALWAASKWAEAAPQERQRQEPVKRKTTKKARAKSSSAASN